jgi:ATP-dependent helicase/nuclease subunit A
VLGAVDLVFAREEVRQGLTFYPEAIEHSALRDDAPGYVELWPSIGEEAVEEPDDWTQAIDHASAPAVLVAEAIARRLREWLDRGEIIEGRGTRLKPGDVLVLVRKRDRFVHALSRALKQRGIEVAGADRLRLDAHIAVQDLIALGRFALQPDDDLSLAALLKSPIFSLDDNALFDLAWDRGAVSLISAMRRKAASDPVVEKIVAQLDHWRNETGFKSAFEFYAAILGRDGARSKFIARLGHEAGEILDEFLNFCLAEEKIGCSGLEAFLETLTSAGPEIKREMDQSRNEVRIMTVHSAKGLEAPVVFLVDSGSAPFSSSHLPRLMPFSPQKKLWDGPGWLWRVSADVANDHSRAAAGGIATKAEEEYRRLLYVGMTRAADRLIVCGYHGKRAPSDMTWRSIVETALSQAPQTATIDSPFLDRTALRFRITPVKPVAETPAEAGAAGPFRPMPEALRQPAPSAPPLPRPLAPSSAGLLVSDEKSLTGPGGSPVLDDAAAPSFAITRGTAAHCLLEMLPDLPEVDREAAATRYLGRFGADWSEAERRAVWDSVARVLADPAFAPVFSESSRAEVSVMGTLKIRGVERAVSGQIDRISIGSDTVQIVDYKTNRPPPATLATVPDAYVAQLAIYRALLQPLYPQREIGAALLFTEAPRLIAVPASTMDDALARLTTS